MSAADVFRIAGIGVVGAVLAVTLRRERPEMAMLVGAVTGIVILIGLLSALSSVMKVLKAMTGALSLSEDFISIALRVTGIALVAQFASQVCRDAGEESIAQKIELGGKVIMLVLTVPLLVNMVELVASFLPAP